MTVVSKRLLRVCLDRRRRKCGLLWRLLRLRFARGRCRRAIIVQYAPEIHLEKFSFAAADPTLGGPSVPSGLARDHRFRFLSWLAVLFLHNRTKAPAGRGNVLKRGRRRVAAREEALWCLGVFFGCLRQTALHGRVELLVGKKEARTSRVATVRSHAGRERKGGRNCCSLNTLNECPIGLLRARQSRHVTGGAWEEDVTELKRLMCAPEDAPCGFGPAWDAIVLGCFQLTP